MSSSGLNLSLPAACRHTFLALFPSFPSPLSLSLLPKLKFPHLSHKTLAVCRERQIGVWNREFFFLFLKIFSPLRTESFPLCCQGSADQAGSFPKPLGSFGAAQPSLCTENSRRNTFSEIYMQAGTGTPCSGKRDRALYAGNLCTQPCKAAPRSFCRNAGERFCPTREESGPTMVSAPKPVRKCQQAEKKFDLF